MPAEPGNSADLVERVRQGDEQAAGELFDHLYPTVAKIARRRLPRGEDPEDLIQEAFMRIFAKLEHYSAQAPIEHWAARVAINCCYSQLARKGRRIHEICRSDLSEEQNAVVDALESQQSDLAPNQQVAALDLVEKLLDRLNPKDQLVIRLFEIERRTFKEIAEITGWNNVAIRVRAMRARTKLKKHLDDLMHEESYEKAR